jgi:hypothetical protein
MRLLVFALGFALAACGGGGGGSYSLDATKSCLEGKNLSASSSQDDLDVLAAQAGEGGLYVEFSETQNANVAFERGETDAKNTEAAYKVFVEGFGGEVGDTIKRKGNVVIAWNKEPSEDDAALWRAASPSGVAPPRASARPQSAACGGALAVVEGRRHESPAQRPSASCVFLG